MRRLSALPMLNFQLVQLLMAEVKLAVAEVLVILMVVVPAMQVIRAQ